MPKPPADLPDHQVTHKPKLDKRTRFQLSTEYKLRLLVEADACQHGELLCRVQLYSSQLTTWRKELAVKNVRVDSSTRRPRRQECHGANCRFYLGYTFYTATLPRRMFYKSINVKRN